MNATLVSRRISQENESLGFWVYPKAVKFQATRLPKEKPVPPERVAISGFSDNSRRRLRFVAVNAEPELTSQFVLTYHNDWPSDGKESKAHLNRFLTSFRYHFPDAPYLWILEFQRRGAPHYHLFTNLEVTEDNRLKLAKIWCQVVAKGDDLAFKFHSNPKNFIQWDMGNGSYVAKYLEKERQKDVPEGYLSVGRFWGASRGLVPMPIKVDYNDYAEAYSQLDKETGEIIDGLLLTQRWLGKWFERQVRTFDFHQRKQARREWMLLNSVLPPDKRKPAPKFKNFRRNFRKFGRSKGFTLLTGRAALNQIESYLYNQKEVYQDDC